MALIYLLPQAEEDAKKIGAYYELMQLVKNCKERTFDEADQLFEKRFPYRYRRMGNRRVVAKIALEQGYPVICFLHLFKKGSDQAEEFNLDPRSYGEKWLESLIDPAALAKVVEEGINQSQEFKTKPKMTDVLYNWWSPFEKVIDADDVVMESEGWVRAMEQRDYGDYWQSYHRLVLDAVAGKGSPVQTDSLVHRVRDSDNRSVYYVSFSSNGHGDAENLITITYLLAPFDRKLGQQDDIERTLIETNAWIRSKALSVDSDSVARHSLRGYPAYILADDRIWREIQQDDVANLALSAEEARLLGELRHAPNGTAVLPVFINGRAGSGKSTILYYLFADYYQRKLKEDLDGEIVFLTYGDRLLKAAKDHVAKLLKTRVDFLVEHSDSARDASNMRDIEAEPIFDKCFQPFLRFARSHVPEQEALKQFPDSRFVDFRRFKQLFLNRNLSQEDIAFALHSPHRGLSADVSWHIIRSFIKGFRAGEYLAPDDYADIPQKERSVSIDLYKRVYTEIWEQWYKVLTTEQGFWDAQDLTREILQQGWAEPKYAVVFCDEAQDFTRVEIDFILRLLVYRKFDLGWQPRVRLPFALAGDPFQTLNPTGFRWEAIKASFYDEIVGNLDPEGRGIVEFYYKELSYNYRSEAPIVRLSNIFQLWREVLFKGSDIHPQRPWREDQHIIPPRLFVLGQSITVDQFADLATTSVIIVPCEQGQEEEFIANDEILLAIQKAGKPLTILSPMSAKGLEFRAVVVYKFGQHCPANFFKKMDFESRLENEYYLNKLYVAATRAMHNLVFVDTIEGRERLWNNAVDPEAIAYYLEQAGAPGQWQGHIAGLTMGDLYGLDVEAQDPLEIAKSLRKGGEEQRNSELMRQAMDFYKRNGYGYDALVCEAKALEFDGLHRDAGALFERIGLYSDSENCFWKGHCWPELAMWYANHAGGAQLRRIVTRAMSSQDPVVLLEFASALLELQRDGSQLQLSESQLQEAVVRLFAVVLAHKDALDLTQSQWVELSDLLDLLEPLHRTIGLRQVAQIHFYAERYHKSKRALEAIGETQSELYYVSMAKTVSKPEDRISWYAKTKRHEDIIAEYQQHAGEKLSPKALHSVADAFESLGQRIEAIEILWSLEDFERALRLLGRELELTQQNGNVDAIVEVCKTKYTTLLQQGQFGYAKELYRHMAGSLSHDKLLPFAEKYVQALVDSLRWEEAVGYAVDRNTRIADIEYKSLPRLRKQDMLALQAVIVRGIAVSDQITEISVKRKQTLSEFLEIVVQSGYANWKSQISVFAMGAAIERLWRFVDILQFYEEIEAAPGNAQIQKFVRERWLKVKTRQINRIEDEMRFSNVHANERIDALRKRQQELGDRARQWNIDLAYVRNLPEFPDVSHEPGHPDPAKPVRSAFNVVWRTPKCKIEHIATGDELLINTALGTVEFFGDLVVQETSTDYETKAILVPAWELEGTVRVGVGIQFTLKSEKYSFP